MVAKAGRGWGRVGVQLRSFQNQRVCHLDYFRVVFPLGVVCSREALCPCVTYCSLNKGARRHGTERLSTVYITFLGGLPLSLFQQQRLSFREALLLLAELLGDLFSRHASPLEI